MTKYEVYYTGTAVVEGSAIVEANSESEATKLFEENHDDYIDDFDTIEVLDIDVEDVEKQ